MKKLQLLALIAVIMLGLSGCEKETVKNEASVDVFVKSIKNEQGITVYTAVHSVFSYNKITSATVTSPTGTITQLTNYENAGNSFYNEPTDADYLTTPPTKGNYVYIVNFDNAEAITYTNSLSETTIQPANITSLVKSADGDSVYIAWDAIANTHAYQLKVEKGTTQVYYQPAFADGSVPLKPSLKLGIPITSLNSSGSGVYTFLLTGLYFESTVTYDYLQALSTAKMDIAL